MKLGRQASADGRYHRAAELASRLVELDRYDEDGHRLLVTALLSSGETAAARRAHEVWTAALDELGVPVEPLDQLTG